MRSNCSEEIKLSHKTRVNTTYNYIKKNPPYNKVILTLYLPFIQIF